MPGQFKSNQHAQQFVIVNWKDALIAQDIIKLEGVNGLEGEKLNHSIIPPFFCFKMLILNDLKRDRKMIVSKRSHRSYNRQCIEKEVAGCTSHLQ